MNLHKENGAYIFKLTAEDLDDSHKMSQVLEKLFAEEGARRIVVDLSGLDAVYSLQIGTLVTLHVLCYEHLAIMKLAGASGKVRALLRMVGLETMMEMHHGAEVAAQSFGPDAEAPATSAGRGSSKSAACSSGGHLAIEEHAHS